MTTRIPSIFGSILLAGCTSTGTVTITTYGEDFIEKEIPATEDASGWTITFDKFLVTIADVTFAHGAEEVVVGGAKVWDLKQPGPHALATIEEVPALHYDESGFTIRPASANTGAGNATSDDVEAMKSNGHAVFVSGRATKGESVKTFAWGFTSATQYIGCEGESGAGIVVTPGGTSDVQLTLHGDHLFMDDLVAEDAAVDFGPFAAADSGDTPDGAITLEELAAVDLTTLPADRYGTGRVPDVRNLRDFLQAQVRSIGHWNGEGECRITTPQ